MKSKEQIALTLEQVEALIDVLKIRFYANNQRHLSVNWMLVEEKLRQFPQKIAALYAMEITGGEPDVIEFDVLKDCYCFVDCAAESPKHRRSLCYDREGWESRKEHRPVNNALDMAVTMGIRLLTESEYRELQTVVQCDKKTSSWILTPPEIRAL